MRRWGILAVACLLWGTPAEATQPSLTDVIIADNAAAGLQLDFANVTTSGSDRAILCFVIIDENNSAATPVATFNTTEVFDSAGAPISTSGTTGRTAYFLRLTAPTVQANAPIAITMVGGGAASRGLCGAYQDVHQTELEDTPLAADSASSASCTSAAVTTDSNDLIVGFIGTDGDKSATLAPSATGQTAQSGPTFSNGLTTEYTHDTDGTSGATQGWTWTGTISNGCIVMNLNGTAVAGGSNQDQLGSLLGVR